MRLTALQLNRATLARQLLIHREDLTPEAAVSRIFALQAQEPASPYLALWTRLTDFDPAALDRAFVEHRIVKATLMRMTLHAVAAEDYAVFHHAHAGYLRRGRTRDPRFAGTGLTDAQVDRLEAPVLEFAGTPRTNAELNAMVDALTGPLPEPRLWWAMRTFARLVHAPTGGPWSFSRRPSYVVAPTTALTGDPDVSLERVARSYFAAFGPASILDIAQFLKLSRRPLRAVVERIATQLDVLAGPDGTVLYDVPGGLRPAGDTPTPPRFLPMWDSVLFAYADRSRIIPSEYRRLVVRQNGDTLPTILVDGTVAGVWLPDGRAISVTPFHPLDDETWAGLAAEATGLRAFLSGREPAVYRRYLRWWASLPTEWSRRLAG